MKWKDEIIEEVHQAADAKAAQFAFDLKRMFEDSKKKEEKDPAPRPNLKLLKPHEQRACAADSTTRIDFCTSQNGGFTEV
jgi:hypothetical protein